MENIEILKQKLIKKNINIDFKKHHINTLKGLNEYLNNKKYNLYDYDIQKIITLLIYDFCEYNISQRIEQIKQLKKDSNSKISFIIRYGEAQGEILYNKRLERQRITSSKEYLFEKYGEGASRILKSKCPNNLNTLINRYGEEIGREKYEKYLKKYKRGISLDGYIEKHGENQGIKKYEDRQNKYTYVNTLEYYIEKYGEKEGNKKWENKNKKISYRRSKQYYIDTFGEKEGEYIFKDNTWYSNIRKKHGEEWYQNFLKEKRSPTKLPIKHKFIIKYGETEGIKKYEVYILKQKYAHIIEYFIEKYGEGEGKQEYLKSRKRLITNLLNKKNSSNISRELFVELKKEIGEDCRYMGHNREMFIYDNEINKLFFYDFNYKNKIIEFHGNFWHADPMEYTEKFIHPVLKITAKEIWIHDEYKTNLGNKHNYDIKIVWENDYKQDKLKIINECLNFLKDE